MKKVLFVNPFGIGDAIFSFYVLGALKRAHPEARVDFLCNERTRELTGMNPDITRAYEFNRDQLREVRSRSLVDFLKAYRSLISDWKDERYEAMFDLSLGREFSFLGMMAGIPRRFGFDFKRRGLFLTHRTAFSGYEGRPVVETQLDLLRRAGIEVPKKIPTLTWSIPDSHERTAEALLKGESSWVVVAPGGGFSWGSDSVFKQWEPEKFVLTANHWARSRGGVLLLGDASERGLLGHVRGGLRVPHVVVCGESLGVVAALLRRSQLFLGNDGGLLHFAHSLGVPSVSVFGPVDEKAYGPYGNDAPREVVASTVACRPCYKSFHFPPCPYDRRCLSEITVQNVLESIDKIA